MVEWCSEPALEICNEEFEKAQTLFQDQPNDFNLGVMFGINLLIERLETACH